VYLRRRIVIETAMTGGMLHDSLSVLGGAACVEVLDGLSGSGMTAEPQSKSGVTYAAKLSSGEARIDWNLSADDIARTVLAFDPWPGTWFEHNGERIKVLSASADTGSGSGSAGKPGEVLDGRPTVACGRGKLVLHRLQRAGRKPQNAMEFLRGYDLPPGTLLP